MNIATTSSKTDIQEVFRLQQKASFQLRQESIKIRKKRIRDFGEFLLAKKELIRNAVHKDFGKPHLEVDLSELYPVMSEMRHALTHLDRWSAPVKVDAPLTYLGTRSEIRYEPKGVCLIISPWNFPVNLCLGPLISCLAAGNTAIIKPSELTPATSKLISELIGEFFNKEIVCVVEGGVEETQQLLKLPFDHIFFTGSPAVGKMVMRAAAENLASVTLELGGKSPVIIDHTANVRDAARRIAFGKFINNGQTCIAPDYVLIDNRIENDFLQELKKNILQMFGNGGAIDKSSTDYARIVNQKHFLRVNSLVQDAIQRGSNVVLSGEVDEESRFISPVVLSNVPSDSTIMEEEIFGPVLPVLTYNDPNEVINLINSKPKPLALYIFSKRKSFQEEILMKTSSGTTCINDCVLQFTHPNLPFGGANNSGLGKAHGFYGFQAFSNEKPVLKQKNGWAMPYLLHPPYTKSMKRLVALMLKWF